jgi:hypothetical protein
VSTPVDSVPLSLPRRSPRGHQSPVKEAAAVLFADDEDDDVVPTAAKEKGDANKKKSSKQARAAPTKKGNKKSAEESSKKEKRQANFSQDEDFMLCCAYVSVSVDPIVGVGQKSEAFWTRVLEKYLLLTEKHLSDYGAELPVRNSASLQQRWKKKIAYQMQLWNKFYRRIKSVKHSGWNEDNYVEEASKLYQEEVGKTFGLEKCVDVLHKLPKFDPMVSGTEESSTPVVAGSDDTSDEDNYFDTKTDEDDAMSKRTSRSSTGSNKKRRVNNSEPAQGSKISRPIGMKKAKKLAKLEAEERSRNFPLATAGAVEASNGIATIAKELVAVFKTNATMKQQDIDSR